MATSDEVAAAITVAQINAQAEYYAAVQQSTATVQAHVQAARIQADAEIEVAHIVEGWQNQRSTADVTSSRITADAHTTAASTQANAEVDAANIHAEAEKYAADRRKEADIETARLHAEASKVVAQTEAQATTATSQYHLEGIVQGAQIAADADRAVAVTHANAETQKATIDGTFAVQGETVRADASRDVATINTANQTEVAGIDAQAKRDVATIDGSFRIQTAQTEGTWHIQVATIEATASNYRADQELAGVNAHENAETGRLATKLNFAQSIYDQIKPIIQQIVDTGTSILGGSGTPGFNPGGQQFTPEPKSPMGFRMGPIGDNPDNQVGFGSIRMGDLTPPADAGQGVGGSTAAAVSVTVPYITSRGVFTPAQLQQQVNQAYARNDARTATQIRKAQGDLAGRGFSSNSPILDALQVGYITSNLRASIEAASQIRLQSSQANVDAVFRGQNAKSEQYLKQEDVLVSAAQVAVQRQVGILNAVASLVGGVL